MACSQFVIIVGASTWFFTWEKEKGESEGDGDANLSLGLHWCWRYHLGSLAYGSFILAVIWFMQLVLALCKKAAKNSGEDKNALVSCIIKCAECCLQCLKKSVEYVNENAYIELALRGENFCTCAKDGVCLMLKHASRFFFTSGLGRTMGLLGKGLICAVNCLFIFVLLENDSLNPDLISPVGPLFVVFTFTYLTADVFTDIFAIAADTFLHCFIMEEDIVEH